MNDLLEVYEREAEQREARTCPGCKVEAGSKRDNDDGRRVWFQFSHDDFKLMPCGVCRPAEAIEWLRAHGELDYATESLLRARVNALASTDSSTTEEQ